MQGIRIEDDEFADLIRGDFEDAVNHPSHYKMTLPDGEPLEAIDVIQAVLGDEGTLAYCRGAALKYQLRAGRKSGNEMQQELEKATWYLNHASGILSDLTD